MMTHFFHFDPMSQGVSIPINLWGHHHDNCIYKPQNKLGWNKQSSLHIAIAKAISTWYI